MILRCISLTNVTYFYLIILLSSALLFSYKKDQTKNVKICLCQNFFKFAVFRLIFNLVAAVSERSNKQELSRFVTGNFHNFI